MPGVTCRLDGDAPTVKSAGAVTIVKLVALVAVPADVVTPIGPVVTPAGTVA